MRKSKKHAYAFGIVSDEPEATVKESLSVEANATPMPDQTVRHSYPESDLPRIKTTNKIKVWLTKYALTSGIEVVEGDVSDVHSGMVYYQKSGGLPEYAHGRDWHLTPEAALERAEEMRRSKLESLRKSIKKLESLKFYIPEDNEP